MLTIRRKVRGACPYGFLLSFLLVFARLCTVRRRFERLIRILYRVILNVYKRM